MAWRKPDQISVKLTVPFVGEISGQWDPSDAERLAAWELYVELVTRVTVVHLGPDEGILREALTSYYSLFGTTREILRRHGPAVAPSRAKGEVSFGSLAVTVINGGIRPTLAKWHPLLTAHEATRAPGTDPVLHERSWDRAADLRSELARTRASLGVLASILATVARAELIVDPDLPIQRNPADQAGGGIRELTRHRRTHLGRHAPSPYGGSRVMTFAVAADYCGPRMGNHARRAHRWIVTARSDAWVVTEAGEECRDALASDCVDHGNHRSSRRFGRRRLGPADL